MRLNAILLVYLVAFNVNIFAMENEYTRVKSASWSVENLKNGDEILYLKTRFLKCKKLKDGTITGFTSKQDEIIVDHYKFMHVNNVIAAVVPSGFVIGQQVIGIENKLGCCMLPETRKLGRLKGSFRNGDAVIVDIDKHVHRVDEIEPIKNSIAKD